ncbi:hypothetical protein BJV74DRAFT_841593 [Russula compacta]|nr:hypothetical protein BJV74DRAFT_841593 [Russula compacta]
MAAEYYFTHLGVAIKNLGGRESGTDTEFSVSEIVNEKTDELLQLVNEEGVFGERKRETSRALVRIYSSRSHNTLLISVPSSHGIHPALAHIIPHSIHERLCVTLLDLPLISL